MKTILQDIRDSRAHKLFLLGMAALFIAAAIWKFSPAPVNARQTAIENATKGFKP